MEGNACRDNDEVASAIHKIILTHHHFRRRFMRDRLVGLYIIFPSIVKASPNDVVGGNLQIWRPLSRIRTPPVEKLRLTMYAAFCSWGSKEGSEWYYDAGSCWDVTRLRRLERKHIAESEIRREKIISRRGSILLIVGLVDACTSFSLEGVRYSSHVACHDK